MSQTDIGKQMEHDYVLERLGEIRDLVADLMDNAVVEPPRFEHTPPGWRVGARGHRDRRLRSREGVDAMTLSGGSDIPATWPRTEQGYCSCPYCTALREGRLEVPRTQNMWLERMGAYGRSKATRAIFGEVADVA